MDLRARRFGKGEALLALVDRSRGGDRLSRRVEQEQFLEYFRRLLAREFHSCSLSQFSCAADLEHSLSPLFVRGLLSRGQQGWAVIGASRGLGQPGCDQILSFALIWLDFFAAADPPGGTLRSEDFSAPPTLDDHSESVGLPQPDLVRVRALRV